MSDNVSITSAMNKELNAYDSDVNIQMKKVINGAPKNLNYHNINDISSDLGSDILVSSV
jgi:hypothetical protein